VADGRLSAGVGVHEAAQVEIADVTFELLDCPFADETSTLLTAA
jgi:hypothetical protein